MLEKGADKLYDNYIKPKVFPYSARKTVMTVG